MNDAVELSIVQDISACSNVTSIGSLSFICLPVILKKKVSSVQCGVLCHVSLFLFVTTVALISCRYECCMALLIVDIQVY